MAIKVGGTTVIDDSRNVSNVGSVTATSFSGDGSGLTNLPAPSGVMSSTNPVVSSGTITEDVYSVSGTSVSLDPENGSMQKHALTGNTTYFLNTNSGQGIILHIYDNTYTVTWPNDIIWVNTAGWTQAPEFSSDGLTSIALWKMIDETGVSQDFGALIGSNNSP